MSGSTGSVSDGRSSPCGALVLRGDPLGLPSTFARARGDQTIGDILDERLPGWQWLALEVDIGGHVVERHLWRSVRPMPWAIVNVRVLPQGGGNGGGASVLLLAASLAGAFLGPAIAGAVGPALGLGAGATGILGRGIGLGLSLIGLLGAALIPQRQPEEEEDESYGIARFRNALQPWGTPPYVRGRLRVYPKKAGQAIVENYGRFQVLRELFDFGPGPLRLSDFRNGDRFLGNFDEDGSYDAPDDFGGYDGFKIEWVADSSERSFRRRFYYGDCYTTEPRVELRAVGQFDPGIPEEVNPPLFADGFDPDDPSTYELAEGVINGVSSSHASKDDFVGEDWKLANYWPRVWPGDGGVDQYYYNYHSVTVGGGTTRADEVILNLTFPAGIYETDENGDTSHPETTPSFGVVVQHGRKTLPDGSPDPDYQKVYLASPAYMPGFAGYYVPDHPAMQPELYRWSENFQAALYYDITLNLQAIAGYTDGGSEEVYSGPFVITIYRVDNINARETSRAVLQTVRVHDFTDVHRLEGHTLAQVRVRSTGQLNGQLDEFNAFAESLVATPDNGWSTANADLVPSSDPYLLAADCLLRAPGADRVLRPRIDLDAFAAGFEANKDGNGDPVRTFDHTFDTRRSVREVCDDILQNARARLVLPDGRYSVVTDADSSGEPIRQLVTPRNARDIVRDVNFVEDPDALRVKFLNQEYSSVEDEIIVAAPDYTLSTAETFEELRTKGVTDYRLAWLLASEAHLEARYRREEVTARQSMAHVAYTVGDVVGLVHPTVDLAQTVVRVISSDPTAGTVTVDTPVEMEAGETYRIQWKVAAGGEIAIEGPYLIETDTTLPTTLTLTDTDGSTVWPKTEAEAIIGPASIRRMKVKSIQPRADLSAQVTLVPEANEIHQSLADLRAGNVPSRDDLRVQDPHPWPASVPSITVQPYVWIVGLRLDVFDTDDRGSLSPPQGKIAARLSGSIGRKLTPAEFIDVITAPIGDIPVSLPFAVDLRGLVIVDLLFELSWSESPTSNRYAIDYSVYSRSEGEVDPSFGGFIGPVGTDEIVIDMNGNGLEPQPEPPIPSWRPRKYFSTVNDKPTIPDFRWIGQDRYWYKRTRDLSCTVADPIQTYSSAGTASIYLGGGYGVAEHFPPGSDVTFFVTPTSTYGEEPLEHATRVTINESSHPGFETAMAHYVASLFGQTPGDYETYEEFFDPGDNEP